MPISPAQPHNASLSARESSATGSIDGRRWPRESRRGNLTLFPQVEIAEPAGGNWAPVPPPRLSASISDVSRGGVGLTLAEQLPGGLEFEVIWEQGDSVTPLRFAVVHSRTTTAGQYRIGARLVMGAFPDESPEDGLPGVFDEDGLLLSVPAASPALVTIQGVLQYLPPERTNQENSCAPAGTFRACEARGFDKTHTLRGETADGSERSLSIRRCGQRLWVNLRSPGNQDGLGLFVDADEFDSVYSRLLSDTSSPFGSSMAA